MKIILPQEIGPFLGFLNEQRCRVWVLNCLHPGGVRCPHCNQVLNGERISRRFYSLKKITCLECKKNFNAFTGTLFVQTRMSCRQIIFMFLLLWAGKRNRDVARLAKVSTATVIRWKDIMQAHGAQLGQRYVDANELLPSRDVGISSLNGIKWG